MVLSRLSFAVQNEIGTQQDELKRPVVCLVNLG